MAAGDCKEYPCGTPLDFDSLLVSLFAADSSGCIGIKTVGNTSACAGLVSAVDCASEMSLQDVIRGAIVDDGEGGYALNTITITDSMTCAQDCAMYQDFETLVKSLFSKDENGCFALRLYNVPIGCEDTESYDKCTASMTFEQLFRTSLWTDACGNPTLGYISPTYEACGIYLCATEFSFDLILRMLFYKYVDGQCGGVNINYAAIGATNLTDLTECGKYMTFEDAFRASLVWNDCGLSLTIWMVGIRGGEQN